MVFYRVDVLENNTDELLELKVEPPPMRPAYSNNGSVISINSQGKEEVKATRFSNRDANPDRIVILRVYLGGIRTDRALIPSQLVNFAKIVFDKDPHGELIIKAFRAKLTDLCRIRGFGFLGRDYHGRPEEIILS
ncbi:unnamed protein product [Camellia sinensis]|uniref:Uncharacterized protein n=1 Tax=Camellia sinensis TaxID=4442 RepID=A0A7J7HG05_CAMSI|nr:hypothetical protein HYC85_009095 [Camellia sinensis]